MRRSSIHLFPIYGECRGERGVFIPPLSVVEREVALDAHGTEVPLHAGIILPGISPDDDPVLDSFVDAHALLVSRDVASAAGSKFWCLLHAPAVQGFAGCLYSVISVQTKHERIWRSAVVLDCDRDPLNLGVESSSKEHC